jgi:phage shock protein A
LDEKRLRDLLNESADEAAERKNRTERFNALHKILDRIERSQQRATETPSTAATQVVAAKPVLATPTEQAPTGRRLADEGEGAKSEDLVRELLNRIKLLEDQVSELRSKLDKLTSKQ